MSEWNFIHESFHTKLRQKERQTDREQRERETETETDRNRETETDRESQRERWSERERERISDRQSKNQRERIRGTTITLHAPGHSPSSLYSSPSLSPSFCFYGLTAARQVYSIYSSLVSLDLAACPALFAVLVSGKQTSDTRVEL